MAPAGGTRARARAATTAEILAAARRQMAEVGAAALSLRAVAREVGLVSSAVYRYFPSRDDLLTALIVESYDGLGALTEERAAATRTRAPLRRWVALARTIRSWGVDHPHQWALLYGSPVPGYAAPESTVGPGTRVSLALLSVVTDAAGDGRLRPRPPRRLPADLSRDLARLAPTLPVAVDPAVLVHTMAAWTQLFGLVSFELFGQTRGVVEAHEQLLVATAEAQAEAIGLPG